MIMIRRPTQQDIHTNHLVLFIASDVAPYITVIALSYQPIAGRESRS